MLNTPFVAQGWQCPICGRVYSPTTVMCFSCPGTTKHLDSTTPPWTPDGRIKYSNKELEDPVNETD